MQYQALLAVAVLVPVIVIGFLMYLYKRKHGHFPRIGNKQLIHEAPIPSPAPARTTRRRGVWRASQAIDNGVPSYTVEAKDGEMSLGMGRKITDENFYELSEMPGQTERSSMDARSLRTQTSFATTVVSDGRLSNVETRSEHRRPSAPRNEDLPPYIPPPSPAIVADRLGRSASFRSNGSSVGVNRLVYPRPQNTPRRL
jgi:hypothetical protein